LLILAFTLLSTLFVEVSATAADKDDESVRELLEELYLEYEAVDKRLIELKEGLTELPAGELSLLTPFTITIKKKKDFILNFIEIKDNGSPLWSHIYTPVENSAMEDDGRHQFFKGSIPKGSHRLTIKYQYSYSADETPSKEDMDWKINVEDEPVFIEILFTEEGSDIIAKPRELHIIDKGAYEKDE
jgi:hypothetical protein